jgi:hypothetical protein
MPQPPTAINNQRTAVGIEQKILFAFSAKRLLREASLSTNREASLSTNREASLSTNRVASLIGTKALLPPSKKNNTIAACSNYKLRIIDCI